MTSMTRTASRAGAAALTVGLATAMLAALSTVGGTATADAHDRPAKNNATAKDRTPRVTGPILRIVSPLADSSVARGAGTPGAGSPDGSGFAFNVEVVTRDSVPVEVDEGPDIRHPELLGKPNPDFPGFTATADVDLVKPDGGLIRAGTNLAALFNVAGTDDTPGPGVTVWAGWHVLESLPSHVQSFSLTASVQDAAGRRSSDRISVAVDSTRGVSGQALTPAPAAASGDGADDADGPKVDLLAPRVPTRVATGPDFAPPAGAGSLFFMQVNTTDLAGNGVGVSENGTGDGSFRDTSQIAAGGPNRNMPGLHVAFDVPLRQPNGNRVPAGQNLAPLFDAAGSELDRDGLVRTVADWVVGGSLELPPGARTVTMTARVTDTAGRTGSDRITVGISSTEDGQALTPQPKKAIPAAAVGSRLAAAMDGAQEISADGRPGAGDPDGTGTFDAVVVNGGGSLCYRLRVGGIDGGTRFHIHRAAAGVNGPIVVAFYETGEQPRDDACVRLDPALGNEIAAAPGGFYVNVHNAAFPAGAVRGQLG